MEDVLEVYCRRYDPRCPVVGIDEMGKYLVADKYPPEAAKPGQSKREDYTYEKQGYANLFLASEPLAGKRFVKVTQRRTKQDWAYFVEELLEEHYPKAETLVLVMDNLNTHTPSSLYETFPPAKARALLERLEIHYTPKHASWLNVAEIELSVLVRQGLAHNVATLEDLCQQVQQWQTQRNRAETKVIWQFTTADARIKLARLYPVLLEAQSALPSAVPFSL